MVRPVTVDKIRWILSQIRKNYKTSILPRIYKAVFSHIKLYECKNMSENT